MASCLQIKPVVSASVPNQLSAHMSGISKKLIIKMKKKVSKVIQFMLLPYKFIYDWNKSNHILISGL